MPKNYYLILGITPDASNEDVKTAFRRRALELHPDRSGLESGPFQDVLEAYGVLSNSERRRHYDLERGASFRTGLGRGLAPEPLTRPRPKGEPLRAVEPSWGFREVSLVESFEAYRPSFDALFDRFWGNFGPFSRPKAERLESLTVELLLTAEEARAGGQVRVWLPARATCPTCDGHGAVGPYECWRCEGQGALTANHPLDVAYPRRVRDGYALRIPLTSFGIHNFYLTVLFRVSDQ